jgi:sugar/nucleoside kinase (ribokinase family)
LAPLESQGIDATHVAVAEGVSSGVAPIFVDSSGQNRITVVKGANDTLSPEDVDAAAPLLGKADTIVLQFEIPLRTVYHTIRFAKANGILCVVNPAPAQPLDFEELWAADYFIRTRVKPKRLPECRFIRSEGWPEKEALGRASLYAALSTTKVGTQKSFCHRGEFDKEWQNRRLLL